MRGALDMWWKTTHSRIWNSTYNSNAVLNSITRVLALQTRPTSTPHYFLFTLILHSKLPRSMLCWHRLLVIDGENLTLNQFRDSENCELRSDCISKAIYRWVMWKFRLKVKMFEWKNRFFLSREIPSHPSPIMWTIWHGNGCWEIRKNRFLPCIDSRRSRNKWDFHSWETRKRGAHRDVHLSEFACEWKLAALILVSVPGIFIRSKLKYTHIGIECILSSFNSIWLRLARALSSIAGRELDLSAFKSIKKKRLLINDFSPRRNTLLLCCASSNQLELLISAASISYSKCSRRGKKVEKRIESRSPILDFIPWWRDLKLRFVQTFLSYAHHIDVSIWLLFSHLFACLFFLFLFVSSYTSQATAHWSPVRCTAKKKHTFQRHWEKAKINKLKREEKKVTNVVRRVTKMKWMLERRKKKAKECQFQTLGIVV